LTVDKELSQYTHNEWRAHMAFASTTTKHRTGSAGR
jgi:hypothetical protein